MTRWGRGAIAAIALTQALAWTAGAQAATIDVAPGQSIQTAVNNAGSGDTIAVAAGTYAERVTVDRSLTLRGAGAAVGSPEGAFLVTAPNVTITGFDVHGATGIGVGATGAHLHFNRFAANATAAIAGADFGVDATDNWFGCNAGPDGGAGCAKVTGSAVVKAPFLTLALTSSSEAIETGGKVTVTASLRTDSASTDLGAIPFPGVPVAFATTLGTVDPSAALVQGAAAATLTVGSSPGIAHVTATLDGATVATDVRVLQTAGGAPPPAPTAPADTSAGGASGSSTGQSGTTIRLVLNTLTGTSIADRIFGTSAAELILGLAGDDELHGGAGDDRLFAGAGQDRVYGDAGDDRVNGGGGDDHVEGGAGNDVVEGSAGRDKLAGGPGNDLLLGGSGADAITDHRGDDTVRAGSGDDAIDVGDGRAGDIVSCGAGRDRVRADQGDIVGKDCETVIRAKAAARKKRR